MIYLYKDSTSRPNASLNVLSSIYTSHRVVLGVLLIGRMTLACSTINILVRFPRYTAEHFMMNKKETAIRRSELSVAHHDYATGLNLRAFFKINDHAKGEDMVQETFMKTWSYLVKGGKIDTMKAFLYHILNNLIIDEYRKHKTSSLDSMLEKGFEPKTGDDSGNLINILDGRAALILIARLPEKYQKVMRMKYVQDLTLAEMSLLTGMTKNALGVRLHRGIEKLKILYEPAKKK